MKSDLVHEKPTVVNVLIHLKWVLLGIFALLVGLASCLSKLHPEKQSKGRDYNYLYSMAESIKNGTEVNLPSLEKKLLSFKALAPMFDPLFTKRYLEEENFDKVDSILKGINERLVIKNPQVSLFSDASVLIEKKDLEGAYLESKAAQKRLLSKKQRPFLTVYNQYRLLLLEELLDRKDEAIKTGQALKVFLEGDGKELVEKSPFLSVIQKQMTEAK